jgi:hypothetical protein
MIKQWRYLVLFTVVILGGAYFLRNESSQTAPRINKIVTMKPIPSPVTMPDLQKDQLVQASPLPIIHGRKVAGIPPGQEASALKKLKVLNTVSTEWKESLITSIKLQGGEAVKDIRVEKTESYIWQKDGIALNVEAVIVSLKNAQGEETKFRAMVDSQTGKILESWDRPVADPLDPREDFHIKLDPRYQ